MHHTPKLVRKYSIPEKSLSGLEKQVLGKLIQAAESISTIYGKQINDDYLGANFYPLDASKEEIFVAAKVNPELLNPYTVVTRSEDGSLQATPYHLFYKKELEPVIELIRDAAKISDDTDFKRRLQIQADALETGSYEAADIFWLTMKPYKIDIVIGPIERYEDRLFLKKTCYSANVGVMDEQATKEAVEIRDAILSADRKTFSLSQKVETNKQLQVRIDHAAILSGLDARALFAATFLPNDPHIIEKYGSEIIIYSSIVEQNFTELYYPVFKETFALNFQKSYSRELLLSGAQKLLLIREISVSLIKYHDAHPRLGELYSVINEISSHVLAVKNAGILLLKDAISQKDLEAIMIMFLCRSYASITQASAVKSMTHYSQGYLIAINYFKESGVLSEKGGVSWVNFTKMFVALNELAATLERILAFGDRRDAERLINEYGKIVPQVTTTIRM